MFKIVHIYVNYASFFNYWCDMDQILKKNYAKFKKKV